MNKLKVGDKVILVAGKDKGKTGSILSVNWKKSTVIVEGINLATKALKPSQENPNGGFVKKKKIAFPLAISQLSVLKLENHQRLVLS